MFLILIIAQTLYAQDTILKKNNEQIIAKVLEIGPTTVKFNKWNNLTGPVFVEAKSDIVKISFANGDREFYNTVYTTKADSGATSSAANNSAGQVENVTEVKIKNRLEWDGSKIYFNQGRINTKDLMGIIESHPSDEDRTKMKQAYKEMTAHKDIAAVSLGSGLILGCAVVFGTAPFVTGLVYPNSLGLPTSEGIDVALIGIFTGGIMRITGFAVSKVQKNKSKAKMREIVNIYNGDYNFR